MGAVIAVGVILGVVYLFCGMVTLCAMTDADLVNHRWVIVVTFLVWPLFLIGMAAAVLFGPVVDMWKDLGRKR